MRRVVLLILLVLPCGAARRGAHEPRKHAPAAFTAEDVTNATQTDPLNPGDTGARVLRAQILLDRARFSPGEIDAQFGQNLSAAVAGYRRSNGLPAGQAIDADVWNLLNRDSAPLLQTYTISPADVKGPFQPLPKDVHERAKLRALGYESAAEELGEKFHVSPKMLALLNPGKGFEQAGVEITVPNVQRPVAPAAAKIVVSESASTVTAMSADGKILAQYPATIGGLHDPLPLGSWTVRSIDHNPVFYYQPGRLWNADPADAKEKLPPGPNNPVGVVWIGLSKKHYGIHGTPDPSLIRRSESSGCIRLTNWDAEDLSHMASRGTPVTLEQ